jgi:hypothetical protein
VSNQQILQCLRLATVNNYHPQLNLITVKRNILITLSLIVLTISVFMPITTLWHWEDTGVIPSFTQKLAVFLYSTLGILASYGFFLGATFKGDPETISDLEVGSDGELALRDHSKSQVH